MANQEFYSRIIHKHDAEENWIKAVNFIPKQGEIIIYDVDNNYGYERLKVGDGVTNVNVLPFINDNKSVDSELSETSENPVQNKVVNAAISNLNTIIQTYILNIDYDSILAFDTNEIIVDNLGVSSILGQGILGQMVLG